MRCLSVQNPYAALICLPATDPRHKRVENRTWFTSYRGDLLIHAGKSRARLEVYDDPDHDDEYGLPISDMAFGAIVAACKLIDCVKFEYIESRKAGGGYVLSQSALKKHPWLATHQHVEGPWCWVLADVRPFPEPVPWSGKQGLFDVPDTYVALGLRHLHEPGGRRREQGDG